MSRIIQSESSAKTRLKLSKSILICIRELMKQTEVTEASKDLAAFIVLALREIHSGIDPSVEAWEKRGYWVKADRFRMDWEWSGRSAAKLEQAIRQDDWASVPVCVIQIAEKFSSVKPPSRNLTEEFWRGAFAQMESTKG